MELLWFNNSLIMVITNKDAIYDKNDILPHACSSNLPSIEPTTYLNPYNLNLNL